MSGFGALAQIGGSLLSSIFGGDGGSASSGNTTIINQQKDPRTPFEKQSDRVKALEQLGGYKGKKSLMSRNTRHKSDSRRGLGSKSAKSKELTAAEVALERYVRMFAKSEDTAAGRSGAITKPSTPRSARV